MFWFIKHSLYLRTLARHNQVCNYLLTTALPQIYNIKKTKQKNPWHSQNALFNKSHWPVVSKLSNESPTGKQKGRGHENQNKCGCETGSFTRTHNLYQTVLCYSCGCINKIFVKRLPSARDWKDTAILTSPPSPIACNQSPHFTTLPPCKLALSHSLTSSLQVATALV